MKSIRYYKKLFPDIRDVIIAQISEEPSKNGVYANCIEYPDLNLLILPTEINKRKVNLKKFFSPDKFYPVQVLNIDQNKKHADVSYSKINEIDRNNYLEKFYIQQKIYKIGCETSKIYANYYAKDIDESMDIIFDTVIWDILISESNIQEIYEKILEDPLLLFHENNQNLDEFKNKFLTDIKKKIKISDIVLSVEFNLICLESGAIDRIKNVLKISTDNKINIKCISSPRYEIIVTENNKQEAEKLIHDTIKIIKDNCDKYCVKFTKQEDIHILRDKTYSFS